jgi:hypothetical protein
MIKGIAMKKKIIMLVEVAKEAQLEIISSCA